MSKMFIEFIVSFISGVSIGGILFIFYSRLTAKKRNYALQQERNLVLNRAKSQAAKVERLSQQRVKDKEHEARKKMDTDIKNIKEQLKNQEYQLKQKESLMQTEIQMKDEEWKKKELGFQQDKETVEITKQKLQKQEDQLQKRAQELGQSLEAVAGFTKQQAQDQLRKSLEDEVKKDVSKKILEIEENMMKEADNKAKLAIANSMARYAAEVTAERTMETLPISGTATKGKIIGRDGRNIRALEATCGVDLIIGEGQEVITISCFDPVRRTVAKKTLEKLMEEGRMHPSLIEETVSKIRREIFSKMKDDGEKTCFDIDIHNVHPEIINVLGSLQYRFIEGQNLLKYSTEVAYISSLLATEIGMNEKIAKRAGLFHAIGLGVPHMVEGSYSLVGAEFCKKYGEKPSVCQAIQCHDGKRKAVSLLDHILQCSYNFSRSRSGSKRSTLDNYVKRLKDLESIANSFDGVAHSFAVQAGKEIRVLVDSSTVVDDHQMSMLSRDIARKIERETNFSGEVKVSVVREYRIVEHAR